MPSLIKYLIQDGQDYKTIANGTLTTVCSVADTDANIETAFRNSGMNDVTAVDNSIISQVVSSEFRIVMFKSPK